ncbi:unnamed protein product [Rangifer tarandus platyrhynchus]|uniref:Uncharacterized protein n=1 Tax=Rangifer tarandus platyrhynchus TaxID=3082113 RepID=A0ABN8XPN4_RANTA|nr:unnamed protein product [Rangifer tarandus platyrhynchus]
MASMQRVFPPGHKAHSFKDPEAPSVRDTGRQKRRTSTFVLALLAHQRAISGCRDVSGDADIRRTVSSWRPFLVGSPSVGLVLFLFLAQQWIVKGALCAPDSMSAIVRARSKAGIELTSPGARRLAERDTEDDDSSDSESIEEEPAVRPAPPLQPLLRLSSQHGALGRHRISRGMRLRALLGGLGRCRAATELFVAALFVSGFFLLVADHLARPCNRTRGECRFFVSAAHIYVRLMGASALLLVARLAYPWPKHRTHPRDRLDV